jgi:predicted enzyme related to lactoylglutathione lyase
MKTMLINTVVLAEDYELIRDWYCRIFDLEILLELDKDYHYSDLGQGEHIILGIARADEMDKVVGKKHSSYVLPQLMVAELDSVISKVQETGCKIIVGPLKDELYYYATIRDPEGNEIWLIEKVQN